jgi:hypothetical protein
MMADEDEDEENVEDALLAEKACIEETYIEESCGEQTYIQRVDEVLLILPYYQIMNDSLIIFFKGCVIC